MTLDTKYVLDVNAKAYRGDLQRPFRFKPSVMGKRCLIARSGGGFEAKTPNGKYALLLSENMAESVSEPAQAFLFPGDPLTLCDERKTLRIKASIESDSDVSIDLLVICSTMSRKRIATWREGEIVSSVNLLSAIPADAHSFGVVLRVTGIGVRKGQRFRHHLTRRARSRRACTHELAMQHKADFLNAHGLENVPRSRPQCSLCKLGQEP